MNAAPCPPGLCFENVEKRYGSLLALRRVNLRIASGDAVVLAGRNGSGKTTLLRVAAGLIRPSSGRVVIGNGAGANARIGFVGHQTMLYDELTAEENLRLFARLLDLAKPGARIETLLAETGLAERRDSLVRTFSRGMRQRLTIARALLQQPTLLLLDEPATGLDVPGTAWLAATLRRLKSSGCTILMSLHGASELSSLPTRAVELEAGRVVNDAQSSGEIEAILRVTGR